MTSQPPILVVKIWWGAVREGEGGKKPFRVAARNGFLMPRTISHKRKLPNICSELLKVNFPKFLNRKFPGSEQFKTADFQMT